MTSPSPDLKVCSVCGEAKSHTEYHSSQRSAKCRVCFNAYLRERYQDPAYKMARAARLSSRREQTNEVQRAYVAQDPERWQAYYRERAREVYDPDVQRAKVNLRRSRTSGNFTVAEWREVCALAEDRCLACGERKPLTADHVVPLSKGGTNTIDNIQPLCGPCNSRKGTRTIDYRSPGV